MLLFGDYSWNKRISSTDKPEDHLGFEERLKYENGAEWWKAERADDHFPNNIKRVRDWPDVIATVTKKREEKNI